MQPDAPNDQGHRAHPGLHAIALVEMGKGVLALLAAGAIATLGAARVDDAIDRLAALSHFDAIHRALAAVASNINPASVHLVVAAIIAYGALRLIEGWGLGARAPGRPGWAPFRSRFTFLSTCMHRPAIPAGSPSSCSPSISRRSGSWRATSSAGAMPPAPLPFAMPDAISDTIS